MAALKWIGALVLASASMMAMAQDTVVYHIDNTAGQALAAVRSIRQFQLAILPARESLSKVRSRSPGTASQCRLKLGECR